MQKLVLSTALISLYFFPLSLFALEGYLGENPGLNFYSKIDDGTYSIQKKLVTREISKSKTFDSFGSKCANAGLLKGIPTSESVLEEIQYGNYTGLSRYLK